MKPSPRRQSVQPALQLIEQAVHLLRTTPLATFAIYYLGTLSFILGLLYFWTDMARSPFASQHLAGASLALSVLFLWMKFCHAIFARNLRPVGSPAFRRSGAAQLTRTFINQAILQPTALFLLPLALLPAIPFPWVFAFYQNVTALDDGESSVNGLIKKSQKLATLWPRQNLLIFTILAAFAFYVFLNWTTVCLVVPGLLKMLLGIESVFTRSTASMFNTTFFAIMLGLTYLCIDPIVEAVYVLRCFYGESLQSGEDLKTELKQFALQPQSLAALLLLILTVSASSSIFQLPITNYQLPITNAISSPELDRALSEVIQQQKYTWRTPRQKLAEDSSAQKTWLGRFLDRIRQMLRHWARAISEWFRKLFHRQTKEPSPPGYGWIVSLHLLLYALIAAVLIAAAILLFRLWRNRTRQPAATPSQPILPALDLADENLGPGQLPEDGWMKLARELMERGELRLAMRAFYLGSLAHLAERNLISLAKFKSNSDYQRELARRGHSLPELVDRFAKNVSVFDRTWYGRHEIDPNLLSQFASNVAQISKMVAS